MARVMLLAGKSFIVKEFNPFQVPGTALGNIQIHNHRRERFRNIFFLVLGAHVALFLTLLIQGCRGCQSGQQQSNAQAPETAAVATAQR